MSFVAPPALRPGDVVAVVAPSGPFERSNFDLGLKLLEARYRPLFTDGLFAQARYLAGDDAPAMSREETPYTSPEGVSLTVVVSPSATANWA